LAYIDVLNLLYVSSLIRNTSFKGVEIYSRKKITVFSFEFLKNLLREKFELFSKVLTNAFQKLSCISA
jgi:hypothetical protein